MKRSILERPGGRAARRRAPDPAPRAPLELSPEDPLPSRGLP